MATLQQYTIEDVEAVLSEMGYTMEKDLLYDLVDALNQAEEDNYKTPGNNISMFLDLNIDEENFKNDLNPFKTLENARSNKDLLTTPSRNSPYKSYENYHNLITSPGYSHEYDALIDKGYDTLSKIYEEIKVYDEKIAELANENPLEVLSSRSSVSAHNITPITDEQLIVESSRFADRKRYDLSPCLRYKGEPQPGRLHYQHDPVKRYHTYKKEWDKQPPPGEQKRLSLRWKVREMMLKKDIPIFKHPQTVRLPNPEWRKLGSMVVADYFIRKSDTFALHYLSWAFCFLEKVVFFKIPPDNEEEEDDYNLMKQRSRIIVNNWIQDLGERYVKLKTIEELIKNENEKQKIIEMENDKKVMEVFLKRCGLAQKHYEELLTEMIVIFRRMDELMEELIPNELKSIIHDSSLTPSTSTSDINLSKAHGYDVNTEIKIFLQKDCFKVTPTDENRSILNELNKLHEKSSKIAKSLTRKIDKLCKSTNKYEKEFHDNCFNLREKIRRYIQKCNELGIDKFYKESNDKEDIKTDDDSDFEDVDIDDIDYLIPQKVIKKSDEDTICKNIKFDNLDKLKFNPHIKFDTDISKTKKEKVKCGKNFEKNIMSKFTALKKRK
uniref:Neurotransmitter-gated ion-channel ligand-binding domain-containing protein n=1 Tax=Strongyloides stercoralis TaxID=6248 RepID=A0AAF5D7Z0_STRER